MASTCAWRRARSRSSSVSRAAASRHCYQLYSARYDASKAASASAARRRTVPQQAWCQNASLKDNIVFGDAGKDDARYGACIEACALGPDISSFPGGDATEVGERGVTLSGGQQARVALARALYADADVYLLDDPLSAVDAHVGEHLFESAICGLVARGKTVVLATHQVSLAGFTARGPGRDPHHRRNGSVLGHARRGRRRRGRRYLTGRPC